MLKISVISQISVQLFSFQRQNGRFNHFMNWKNPVQIFNLIKGEET